jgi:hypothetical protein
MPTVFGYDPASTLKGIYILPCIHQLYQLASRAAVPQQALLFEVPNAASITV